MPAMDAPTRKRRITKRDDVGSMNTVAPVAKAPTIAEVVKKRRDSIRSASPRTALSSVPATNPSATLLERAAAWGPADRVLRFERGQHRRGGEPQRHAEHLAHRQHGEA